MKEKQNNTAWNDTSSRSHAIGTISIKQINKRNQIISDSGKLLLVDLAGSEKAQDSQSNIKERRVEGAEINTSLLALKEWIRAMDSGKKHVPFRQSKLTMVLRDSFIGGKKKNHVIMIAWISPDQSSSDHTLNTLRYAERLKYNTDELDVEKYMNIKKAIRKSPETSFHDYEDHFDESKLVDSPYRNPQLYQSHEVSVHLPEANGFNDIWENFEIEDDNSLQVKQLINSDKKMIGYENEHPNFEGNYNSIHKNYQEERTYNLSANKTIDYEWNKNKIDASANKKNKQGVLYEGWRTHSYSQAPQNIENHYKYREYIPNTKVQIDAPEFDYEDQLMQINTEDGEEHHNPPVYTSHPHKIDWESMQNRRKEQAYINPTLYHSNSTVKPFVQSPLNDRDPFDFDRGLNKGN